MTARWTSTASMVMVLAVGVVAFGWPFLADPQSGLAHGQDASYLFAVLMGLLGLVLLADLTSGRADAKTVAVLGVLAAAGGALRVLSAGTAGLEPMFFLIVIAGRVLGPRLGFLMGALALLASAFLTAGVGPWTPFQMITCGWVALGAGLLPTATGWAERLMLAGYGVLAGLAYGALMNLWFWPFLGTGTPAGAAYVAGEGPVANLHHYGLFYATTSLAWDLPRGLLTGVLVLVSSRPLLRALRRSVRRARFGATGQFAPAP